MLLYSSVPFQNMQMLIGMSDAMHLGFTVAQATQGVDQQLPLDIFKASSMDQNLPPGVHQTHAPLCNTGQCTKGYVLCGHKEPPLPMYYAGLGSGML